MDHNHGDEVQSHYNNHLASFYSWMLGDYDLRVKNQKSFFEKHGIIPFSKEKMALDLGAGAGHEAIALTQLGFKTYAVDFCPSLLAEIKDKSDQIHTICSDITHFSFLEEIKESPELILCMGDTLTHLSHLDEVDHLLSLINEKLCPQGKLILTFRDYTTLPQGVARFIPVKSDENQILTCFLEDKGQHLEVTDLFYSKNKTNSWGFTKSSYKKIKINPMLIVKELENKSFHVEKEILPSGMISIMAQK